MVYKRSNSSYACIGGPQDAPWLNIQEARRPAYDSQLPVPLTPLSLGYLTTPDSLGDSSPGSASIPIPPSPRKRCRQRSAPYSRSRAESTLVLSTDPGTAVALDSARVGLRLWIEANTNAIEPSIGSSAAAAIIGSNAGLGTPGRSLYSAFFSSRSGKHPFTCYECGHEEGRFSRAVRHQRQEHFGHYPFPCQGGSGHSAWYAVSYLVNCS